MDTFYIEPEKFWELFDKPDVDSSIAGPTLNKSKATRLYSNDRPPETNCDSYAEESGQCYGKRMKRAENKPRILAETEAGSRCDSRYIIMWGPHKPGKKNKVWEGDGYLTLIRQMAHLSDLKGRLLEEPTILDDVDLKCIEEFGELMIGNTEIQIVEEDKNVNRDD